MTKKEIIMNKITEMENEIKNLKQEIGKQEELERRWKPELDGRYWFIDDDGNTFFSRWDNDAIDNSRYKFGNVFKTEEEADFTAEQFKVIAELKNYAGYDKEWNGKNGHWYIGYETNEGCLSVNFCQYIKKIPFNIYFSSKESAENAINAIGKDRLKKYYFCMEK